MVPGSCGNLPLIYVFILNERWRDYAALKSGMKMLAKNLSVICCLHFGATLSGAAIAVSPQSLESFEKELDWVNITNCRKPPVKPPPPVRIAPLNESLKSKKRISIRRWLDEDGDGQCELYDVEELGKSYYTGKIYGYPIRRSWYEKGKWNVGIGSTDGWFPLILIDRLAGARYEVFYTYENAGYSAGSRGPVPDCESMRWTLAVGYMLFFHFPKFAKDDPVMDPDGEWNDYKSAYVNSHYPGKKNFLSSPVPDECKERYRLVIDALAKELED